MKQVIWREAEGWEAFVSPASMPPFPLLDVPCFSLAPYPLMPGHFLHQGYSP